ncbi:MAG TPA: Fur family transcriptional regulator [Candidatus Nanoarchaeia archaeon]|nr:Fur family transcriptional regulator [Candidatus Nanoarchaeia archaeon]
MVIDKQKRNTVQKLKIKEYLGTVKTHPKAEVVYVEVKKEIPTITLATVYRNLNSLAEEGEILRLEIGNEFHFDADISRHQHYFCTVCGKVRDIFLPEISDYALEKVNLTDFAVSNVMVVFQGVCKECQR